MTQKNIADPVECPGCGSTNVKGATENRTENTEQFGEVEQFADFDICGSCGLVF